MKGRSAPSRPSRPREPVKVLHLLSWGFAPAAAQARIVAALGRGLDRSRFRLLAWFLGDSGPLAGELERSGVATRAVRFRGVIDPLGGLRFARALRSERPSLIHSHVGGRSRMWLSRSTTDAKLMAHLHATHTEACTPIPLRRLARASSATIAVSHAVAEGVPDAVVISPGVDVPPNAVAPGPTRPPTVGTVARLEPVKGLDTLLEAAAALRPRHPNLLIELAGSGSAEPQLRERARRLGISDAVAFLGWQEDVGALHARWSVFAAPSIEEGLGLAALEAMASRLPVVASATGGLTELVDDRSTGFLVPVRDSAALARRVDLLLSDASLRVRMGEAGAERARRDFAPTRMVDAVGALYDRVLAS